MHNEVASPSIFFINELAVLSANAEYDGNRPTVMAETPLHVKTGQYGAGRTQNGDWGTVYSVV